MYTSVWMNVNRADQTVGQVVDEEDDDEEEVQIDVMYEQQGGADNIKSKNICQRIWHFWYSPLFKDYLTLTESSEFFIIFKDFFVVKFIEINFHFDSPLWCARIAWNNHHQLNESYHILAQITLRFGKLNSDCLNGDFATSKSVLVITTATLA